MFSNSSNLLGTYWLSSPPLINGRLVFALLTAFVASRVVKLFNGIQGLFSPSHGESYILVPIPGFSKVRKAHQALSGFMKQEISSRVEEVRSESQAADERSDTFTVLDYSDYEKLNKVLALFFESLRLFPASYLMVRESTEDTILTIPNPVGEEGTTQLPVQKNTLRPYADLRMYSDYNPRYFDSPEDSFRPSGWYDTHNESETFPAFSIGPRACIGRKFTTVEAVAFLMMLLRDWRFDPVFRDGETIEMWRERVLPQTTMGLTLGVQPEDIYNIRPQAIFLVFVFRFSRIPFPEFSSQPVGGTLETTLCGNGVKLVVYKGGETFSVIPFILGVPTIFTSNVEVMRQILSDRKTSFQKDQDSLKIIRPKFVRFSGWRRLATTQTCDGPRIQQEVVRVYLLETLSVAHQGWSTMNTVDLPFFQTISTKMALLIVAKCGFQVGFSVDWSAPPTDPDGTISIQEALRVDTDSYVLSLMVPNWVRSLPLPGFAKVHRAVHAFSAFMSCEVAIRREEVRGGSESSEERVDAFTMLVRANEQETEKRRLTDQEVIGNVFILLFAGHETTAHTMSTALALLAVHQNIQNEVFEQIQEVAGDESDIVYDDHEKLNKVLAVFFETLRLFPPASILMRETAEDTVLNLPNPVGEDGSTPLAIQKDTMVVLDILGAQRNPRYFSDPEEFKPSRWYEVSSESEAFPGFSLGPRACIGRKFAAVEAVAFLTMLLHDWHVTPVLEAGETPRAWQERVLDQPMFGLTMTLRGAPVRLTKRTSGDGFRSGASF
ncbi:hypothetical protein H0H92_006648 [Tricholoma furcatifolium]|nr:hypothetical protein H0H92_006648 [Tricholoma furcatifolium]